MSMASNIVEAGKLLITSEEWPATDIPAILRGKIFMGKTAKQGYRFVNVTEDGLQYKVLECNPEKVVKDRDGNEHHDKAMVGSATGQGFIGQVRRLKDSKEDWHFFRFKEGQ